MSPTFLFICSIMRVILPVVRANALHAGEIGVSPTLEEQCAELVDFTL
jgi:hypothetical protein